ncbi:MAG: hypothetical protein OXF85_00690 [Candidatus Saccharibacteria bacterium]|nr:hypothetical protein [Candidatus Saccharibacteria bacterium]
MGGIKYSLAVSSKVPLHSCQHLSRAGFALGQILASQGHALLTEIGFNLAHQVALGMTDKAGLSIGFSPARNLRYHTVELQLPVEGYDWIYYTASKDFPLLAQMISNAQGVILVGGVMDNLVELSLALEIDLPVGILLDETNQDNNTLLNYLRGLPVEQQRRVVIHQDPQILLTAFNKIIAESYQDLDSQLLADNKKLFDQIMADALKIKSQAQSIGG